MLKKSHLKGFNLAETKTKETDQGECPKLMDFCFFLQQNNWVLEMFAHSGRLGDVSVNKFMKLGICIVTGS